MAVWMEGEGGALVESHAGCVLELRERNGYDDSDFYALVWDAAAGQVRSVEYGTTRFASRGRAAVDATPEVRALAARAFALASLERWRARAWRDALTIETGKEVRTTRAVAKRKPRTVAAGEVGVVERVTEDSYRSSRWGTAYVAVVRFPDGQRIYLPDDALEVVDPADYLPDEAEGLALLAGWEAQPCHAARFDVGWLVLPVRARAA